MDKSVVVYFFQADVLFSIENAKVCTTLSHFDYFVTNYGLVDILLHAKIMRWCTKIDKYQVWIKATPSIWTHFGKH